MMARSSFQWPKPGRVYRAEVMSRGRARDVLVVEIRVAPGVLRRTSLSINKYGVAKAMALAHFWCADRWPEQKKNYRRAFAEWKRSKGDRL